MPGENSALDINSSTISENASTSSSDKSYGAGIYADENSPLSIATSSVAQNVALANDYAHGGGIYAKSTFAMTSSTVSDNQAHATGTGSRGDAFGGGISFSYSIDDDSVSTSISDSVISGNTVVSDSGEANSGGIYCTDEVRSISIDATQITNNTASGATATGGGGRITGTISNSEIDNNSVVATEGQASGGGLGVGNVSIDYSKIHDNSAKGPGSVLGGGLYSGNYGSTVSLANSAVYDNTVEGTGTSGNVLGGGMSMMADLTVTNSTFSGNAATGTGIKVSGGGVYSSSEIAYFYNVTIAYNSSEQYGGGFAGGSYKNYFENSLIADNTATSAGADCYAISYLTTLRSLGNNLVADIDTCMSEFDADKNDLIGSASDGTKIDPLLRAFGDNGGFTFTHALGSGSPAIDAANNTLCESWTEDQRGTGYSRTVGTTCDIGAYELQ